MRVAVLGASVNPTRYSYLAIERLRAKGHEPIGVSPGKARLPDLPWVAQLSELPSDIHTLTMYVGPDRSRDLGPEILKCGFQRVIFNPGTENADLMEQLRRAGIEVVEGCTLVMLAAGSF